MEDNKNQRSPYQGNPLSKPFDDAMKREMFSDSMVEFTANKVVEGHAFIVGGRKVGVIYIADNQVVLDDYLKEHVKNPDTLFKTP